jgi:hypothetical protein
MKEETKDRIVKIGKTIGIGLIGAVIATAVLIGYTLLKGGGGGSDSSGEAS